MNRDAMLARVRTALGHPRSGDGARVQAAMARVRAPSRHLIPNRASGDPITLVQDFVMRAQEAGAGVHQVEDARAIPSLVARIAASVTGTTAIRRDSDPFLQALPWNEAPHLPQLTGAATAADKVTVSHALAGVAETGTLVLVSRPECPTTLALLPELHIVVLGEDAVVGALEDAMDRVRAQFGQGGMPRAVMLVTGPSRTGDIGGRLVMGAHGPQRLEIILAKGSEAHAPSTAKQL